MITKAHPGLLGVLMISGSTHTALVPLIYVWEIPMSWSQETQYREKYKDGLSTEKRQELFK